MDHLDYTFEIKAEIERRHRQGESVTCSRLVVSNRITNESTHSIIDLV